VHFRHNGLAALVAVQNITGCTFRAQIPPHFLDTTSTYSNACGVGIKAEPIWLLTISPQLTMLWTAPIQRHRDDWNWLFSDILTGMP